MEQKSILDEDYSINLREMKSTNLRSLLLVLVVATVFFGCKKKEARFIEGTWKRTKIEMRLGSNPWEEITESCNLDDTEEYTESGNWSYYDGTNQCNPGSGIMTGTWKFAADNTKIIYTYTGIDGEYESTIESIEKKKLVLTYSSGDLLGTQYKYTYEKQ